MPKGLKKSSKKQHLKG